MWPQVHLPLSSRPLTIPEPTVPAPPRTNTTLSELDMLAAASLNRRWRNWKYHSERSRWSRWWLVVHSISANPGCFKREARGHGSALLALSLQATPAGQQNDLPHCLHSRCTLYTVDFTTDRDCDCVCVHTLGKCSRLYRSLAQVKCCHPAEETIKAMISLDLDTISNANFLTIYLFCFIVSIL